MPWPWLGDPRATAARRAELMHLLGPPAGAGPVATEAPSGHLLSTSPGPGGSTIERWRLNWPGAEDAPAVVVLPGAGQPLRGVVLYNHAHGNRFELGGDELLVGRPALQSPAYGEALATRGWAAVAIDHCAFGQRQVEGGERRLVKLALWQGGSVWGWRVRDSLATLAWLRTLPRFAPPLPVVTLGLSMGSTMAIWTAALAPEVAGCVDLCCAAEYEPLAASGGIDGHGEYFFVPGLTRHFKLAEICALIAPRPHLSLAGRADPLTPPSGLQALDLDLRRADKWLGTPGRWLQHVEPGGHAETATMRQRVLEWFEAFGRS